MYKLLNVIQQKYANIYTKYEFALISDVARNVVQTMDDVAR